MLFSRPEHGVLSCSGNFIAGFNDIRVDKPLTILDEVIAPQSGILFTIRDYPIVDEGSLMGRILKEEVCVYE